MDFQQLKTWQSYQKQLALLKQRGLIINDEHRALHYLKSLGYYRLSGYFYPFRQFETTANPIVRKDDFMKNSHFDDVLRLYMFDKQLRILAFDVLERIEMAIRVDVAYLLGQRGTNAHEQPHCLHMKKSAHEKWLAKYNSLVNRAKNNEFIAHNLSRYGCLPIWVACEILDFGALSRLYHGMRYKDKEKIAQKYGVTADILSQWLRSLNFIRNVVAHHSRLWNANIVERTDFSKSFPNHKPSQKLENHKAFGYFYIMAYLLKTISPTSTWQARLREHIENNFPKPSNQAIRIEDFGYLPSFQNTNWQIV